MRKRRVLWSLLMVVGLIAVGYGVVLVNNLLTPEMICDAAVRRGDC